MPRTTPLHSAHVWRPVGEPPPGVRASKAAIDSPPSSPRCAEHRVKAKLRSPSLETLPADVLLQVVTRVHEAGQHHMQALAEVSLRLAEAVQRVGPRGDTAVAAGLARRAVRSAGCGIALRHDARSAQLRLTKTDMVGDAFVVFDRCVGGTSAYWRFRIDRFRGCRIEVGVAEPGALGFGTVERRRSWSFDCFGRVCAAGQQVAYGRRMREGDVVGVLYDARSGTLSFLDNGVCMGVVPVGGGRAHRGHLLPFVYMPFLEGEQVTLLAGAGPVHVEAVRRAGCRWRRPLGLPYDGAVVVQTWDPRVWYALWVDTDTTSVACFWGMVERRHGMARDRFELIFDGVRLVDTDAVMLSELGICIDERSGTCRADVLLSVPHAVS